MSDHGATPEDLKTFEEIIAKDPDSKNCFECGYFDSPWCDVSHGLFLCLDCSGRYRGLGVHLAFVRSSTMDGWSNWKPEKLQVMKCGGNSKYKKFCEKHKIPLPSSPNSSSSSSPSGGSGGVVPLKQRFSHRAALMYIDKLIAESSGQMFNENTWKPPQWWVQEQQQQNQQQQSSQNRNPQQQKYQSYASAGSQNSSSTRTNASGGGDDFLSFLGGAVDTITTGASKAVSTAAVYGAKAAEEVKQGSKQLVESVEKSTANSDISASAQKSAAAVSEVANSAWGTLSGWTTTGFSAISAMAKDAGTTITKTLDENLTDTSNNNNNNNNNSGINNNNNNNDDDEDGGDILAGLARKNLRPAECDYGHAEHRAENKGSSPMYNNNNSSQQQKRATASSFAPALPSSSTSNNSNSNISNNLNTKSSPTTRMPSRQNSSPTITTTTNTNSNTNILTSGPKPVAVATTAPKNNNAAMKKATEKTAISPVVASPSSNASNSSNKKEVPASWGWDE